MRIQIWILGFKGLSEQNRVIRATVENVYCALICSIYFLKEALKWFSDENSQSKLKFVSSRSFIYVIRLITARKSKSRVRRYGLLLG